MSAIAMIFSEYLALIDNLLPQVDEVERQFVAVNWLDAARMPDEITMAADWWIAKGYHEHGCLGEKLMKAVAQRINFATWSGTKNDADLLELSGHNFSLMAFVSGHNIGISMRLFQSYFGQPGFDWAVHGKVDDPTFDVWILHERRHVATLSICNADYRQAFRQLVGLDPPQEPAANLPKYVTIDDWKKACDCIHDTNVEMVAIDALSDSFDEAIVRQVIEASQQRNDVYVSFRGDCQLLNLTNNDPIFVLFLLKTYREWYLELTLWAEMPKKFDVKISIDISILDVLGYESDSHWIVRDLLEMRNANKSAVSEADKLKLLCDAIRRL